MFSKSITTASCAENAIHFRQRWIPVVYAGLEGSLWARPLGCSLVPDLK
jgi:hypothetical protein